VAKNFKNTKQKEIKTGKAERWMSRGCTSIMHAIVSKFDMELKIRDSEPGTQRSNIFEPAESERP